MKRFETQLVIFADEQHPCSYLPDRQARMPLLMPVSRLAAHELDTVLEQGYRRSGKFVYFTACAKCQACEPTRIRIDTFRWTTSLKRVKRRGDADFETRLADPHVDPVRLHLFNQHRFQRNLTVTAEAYTAADYRDFLVDSCCDTQELSFWYQGRLVGCAIVDVGAMALSAVYTYFDPAFSRWSIGTYAILKELEWAEQLHKQWVYLGMYVAENEHLNYKARFVPQERLLDGKWQPVP